jgi:hypothetical protein
MDAILVAMTGMVALVQSIRRGHYELAVEELTRQATGGRIRRTDLGDLISSGRGDFSLPWAGATQL